MGNIDYYKIVGLIKGQFVDMMNANYAFYKDYRVLIDLEQQFIKREVLPSDSIFIVVSFSPSSVLFGQTAIPCTLTIMAEENKIDVALRLLTDYAEQYNLKRFDLDKDIQQVYNLPSVSRNFDIAGKGYRSIIRLTGTFVVTPNANFYKVKYRKSEDEDYKEVECISKSFNISNNLDTQVFYGQKNFPKSISKFATITLSISTYLLKNNDMLNAALKIATKKFEQEDDGTNTTFYIQLEFSDGEIFTDTFKMVSFNVSESVGNVPAADISFTN